MQGYFAYLPELMKWVEWEREHEGAFNASHLQPSIYEYYPPGTQAVQAFTGIVSIAFFLLTCVLTCQLRAMVRPARPDQAEHVRRGLRPRVRRLLLRVLLHVLRAGADAPPRGHVGRELPGVLGDGDGRRVSAGRGEDKHERGRPLSREARRRRSPAQRADIRRIRSSQSVRCGDASATARRGGVRGRPRRHFRTRSSPQARFLVRTYGKNPGTPHQHRRLCGGRVHRGALPCRLGNSHALSPPACRFRHGAIAAALLESRDISLDLLGDCSSSAMSALDQGLLVLRGPPAVAPWFCVPDGCYALVQRFGKDMDYAEGQPVWPPALHWGPPWVQVLVAEVTMRRGRRRACR